MNAIIFFQMAGKEISRRGLIAGFLGTGILALTSEACAETSVSSDLDLHASRTSYKGFKIRYLQKGEIKDFVPVENEKSVSNKTAIVFNNKDTATTLVYTSRKGRGEARVPAIMVRLTPPGNGTIDTDADFRYLPFDPTTLDQKIDPRVVAFENTRDGSKYYLGITVKPQNETFAIRQYKAS